MPELAAAKRTSGKRWMRDVNSKRKALRPPVVAAIGMAVIVLCLIVVSFCCPQQTYSGSDFINNRAEHRWILALRDGSLGFFYQHNVGQWYFSSSYFEEHLNFPRGQIPNAEIGLPDYAGAVVPLWPPFLLCIFTIALLLRRSNRSVVGRCPGCGYDLAGNTSGRCPECGAPTNTANQAPSKH